MIMVVFILTTLFIYTSIKLLMYMSTNKVVDYEKLQEIDYIQLNELYRFHKEKLLALDWELKKRDKAIGTRSKNINMKASEFNEIDNSYFLIEENTKKVCEENNICFYNYLGVFKRLLINYISSKKHVEKVKNCDFNDVNKTKAILNKSVFSSNIKEVDLALISFKQSRLDLFKWLDKTKDHYFFILNPIYNYGAGIDYDSYISKRHGYQKEKLTGSENIAIAFDYAMYKIFG